MEEEKEVEAAGEEEVVSDNDEEEEEAVVSVAFSLMAAAPLCVCCLKRAQEHKGGETKGKEGEWFSSNFKGRDNGAHATTPPSENSSKFCLIQRAHLI